MTVFLMNNASSNFDPRAPENLNFDSWRRFSNSDPSVIPNSLLSHHHSSLPLFNQWKPIPSRHPPYPLVNAPQLEPIQECIILDQDPHRFPVNTSSPEIQPPPPPPNLFINTSVSNPLHSSNGDIYFFNPPPSAPRIPQYSPSFPDQPIRPFPQETMRLDMCSPDGRTFFPPFPSRPHSANEYPESHTVAFESPIEDHHLRRDFLEVRNEENRTSTGAKRDRRSPVNTTSRGSRRSGGRSRSPKSRRKADGETTSRRERHRRSRNGGRSTSPHKRSQSPRRRRRNDERSVKTSSASRSNSSRKSKTESSDLNSRVDDESIDVAGELQAFAMTVGDPEEFRQKLANRLMEKNMKKNLEAKRQETMNDISLYYNHGDYAGEATTPTTSKSATEASFDDNERENSSSAASEGDISLHQDSCTWYQGAPMQKQIGEKFRALVNVLYQRRPQQPIEDGIERTFPVKKRNLVAIPEPVQAVESSRAYINGDIVKECRSGYVIRSHGSTTWVRKTPTVIDTATRSVATSANSPRPYTRSLTAHSVLRQDTNECFEFLKSKKCSSGLLCKYNHDGSDDHKNVKFCHRFMSGLCRNGESCQMGSHSLLPHQMPVCDYYLRGTCQYPRGCPFLHVKTKTNGPSCIHFNKGRCLADPLCEYAHRYCPMVIRERCASPAVTDACSAVDEVIDYDNIPVLQWM